MLLSLLFLSSPAYAAGNMVLLPDPALVVLQTFPFLAAMVALHAILFKPMMAYLADREAATKGAREEAVLLTQEADQKEAEYQQHLLQARREVMDLRTAARAEEKIVREAHLAKVRTECEATLKESRTRIESERALAAKELDRMAGQLAGEISRKVLGRELGGAA